MAIRRGSNIKDLLRGSAVADLLLGFDGNDTLFGGAGNDRLDGGSGNDRLFGGPGDDYLIGGAGKDLLEGGTGDDLYRIDGSSEINRATRDPGVDRIDASVSYRLGASQEDLYLFGKGAMVGIGNARDNWLSGNNGATRLDGGGGNDTLQGHAGDDVLRGGTGIDALSGGAGDDLLIGGPGADSMGGDEGDDHLVADLDDTEVHGGTGQDRLSFTSAGVTFAWLSARARGIEFLDLQNNGADTVTTEDSAFTIGRLLAGSEQGIARVRLDAEDVFAFEFDEVLTGRRVVSDGVAYDAYRFDSFSSGDELLIEVRPGVLPLTSLNGTNGLRLTDATQAWNTVAAAGDVNGDGYDDVLFGNSFEAPLSGVTLFGRPAGQSRSLALDDLDGGDGFRVDGHFVSPSGSGTIFTGSDTPARGGDFNGDGFDDLLFGSLQGDDGAVANLVFGAAGGFAAQAALTALPAAQVLRFAGSEDRTLPPLPGGGFSVEAVALGHAGDLNGDGYDDLVIAEPNFIASIAKVGRVYVVHGGPGAADGTVDLGALDGTNGFSVTNGDGDRRIGYSVGGAGDVNGDGVDDLLIGGGHLATPEQEDGTSVVFGVRGVRAATLDVADLDGSNGFRLLGLAPPTGTGTNARAAGDVNGDGLGDLVVVDASLGVAYVLFGRAAGFAAAVDVRILAPSEGFVIAGGIEVVSGAGDVNGDGYDDLLLGAPGADLTGVDDGAAYLVFGGGTSLGSGVDLSVRDPARVLTLQAASRFEVLGKEVTAAGDVNGDGLADVLIGASDTSPTVTHDVAGYLVHGDDWTGAISQRGGSGSDEFIGTAAADNLVGGQGDDLLDGGGGADVLYGGAGDDVLMWDDQLRRAAGGSGIDTLRVGDGAGQVDLTALPNSRLSGIERIVLAGSGDQVLTLGIDDVLALPDRVNVFVMGGTRQLVVDGDAGDTVHSVGQGWVRGADVTLNGTDYVSYTHGSRAGQLLIDLEIALDIS